MAHLAAQYSHDELAYSALGLIPWGHVALLLCIVADKAQRETLAQAANESDWTLAELWDKINDEFNHSPRPPRPRKRPQKLQ